MTPEESLRLKCLQLAIETRGYSRAGVDLISAATAIEEYVAGKHAETVARPNQPAEFSPAQEEAVRNIVADQLATILKGADHRIREEMAASADRSAKVLTDICSRIVGVEGVITASAASLDTAQHGETAR